MYAYPMCATSIGFWIIYIDNLSHEVCMSMCTSLYSYINVKRAWLDAPASQRGVFLACRVGVERFGVEWLRQRFGSNNPGYKQARIDIKPISHRYFDAMSS